MVVRRATALDVRALVALERVVPLAPHWSETLWQEAVESEGRGVLVAEREGVLVGFVVGNDVAGVVELESVVVSGLAQRSGVGSALLEGLRGWARERGARSMELEVRESNVVALAFYRSHGFVEQARRQRYYSAPVEDAILMMAVV